MPYKFYFAYGSNLNLHQLAKRCPEAEFVAPAILEDWALTFRGVADIVREPGSAVHGAIFSITRKCEVALDRYEGYPRLYGKKNIIPRAIGPDGRGYFQPAMVYTMNGGDFGFPWEGYLQTIIDGYKHCGIDPRHLKSALRELPARIADNDAEDVRRYA